MVKKETDREFYVKQLASEECLCGNSKLRGNSFCYRCYKALPGDMQKAIYRSLGRGYEEAFEAAHKWLTENIW